MEIIIEAGAIEYLKKADTNRLVISMIPNRTSTCCGTGKTRKFYTPEVRPARPAEYFGNGFRNFQPEGLDVWVSQKAFDCMKDVTVTISLKRTLFGEELECKGIEMLLFD
jgi:hypothetical protein